MIHNPRKDVSKYLSDSELLEKRVLPSEITVEHVLLPVEVLELQDTTMRVLSRYDIRFVGELSQDILTLPGIGLRVIDDISTQLKELVTGTLTKSEEKENSLLLV